jgi:hypothetical protein
MLGKYLNVMGHKRAVRILWLIEIEQRYGNTLLVK